MRQAETRDQIRRLLEPVMSAAGLDLEDVDVLSGRPASTCSASSSTPTEARARRRCAGQHRGVRCA